MSDHASDDPSAEKQRWLDHPRNVDRIFYALCVACAGLMLTDVVYHKHGNFRWEGWFGFYGLYGFICCVLLVLSAKQLRRILRRGEDYYDK